MRSAEARAGAERDGGAGATEALAAVEEAASSSGAPAHLVGGAVRDELLGIPSLDLDVAIEGGEGAVTGISRRLSARPGFSLARAHERFGTATFHADAGGARFRIDLSATRTETYPRPGLLPVVRCGATLGEDLSRRDFTVNAMCRRVEPEGRLGPILAPHGGLEDLSLRRLRLLTRGSLTDDPTRAFRGVRYAARLGFHLDDAFETSLEAARQAGAFGNVSGERLRRVLEEILLEKAADAGCALLARHGLLEDVVPGWKRPADAPAPSVQGPPGVEDRWAAFLTPLPPRLRGEIAARLRFPRRLLARVVAA